MYIGKNYQLSIFLLNLQRPNATKIKNTNRHEASSFIYGWQLFIYISIRCFSWRPKYGTNPTSALCSIWCKPLASSLQQGLSVVNTCFIGTYMQYQQVFTDVGMAIQFLSFVSTEAIISSRPKDNPTVEEILTYTLQMEIRQTCKLYSYSGKMIL